MYIYYRIFSATCRRIGSAVAIRLLRKPLFLAVLLGPVSASRNHVWTIDLFASFVTGFHREGVLVQDLVQIRWRYFRAWFVPDVALVVSDYTTLFLTLVAGGGGPGSVMMLRFARLGLFLRVAGILRAFRFTRIVEDLMDQLL